MARERLIASRRQRLFDERDAGFGAGVEIDGEIVRVPTLVGIDDEFGSRRGIADRADALGVALRRRA